MSFIMEMLISFSSRTCHLPTLPKVPKAGSMTWCYCANSPDSIENLCGIVKRKMRHTRTNIADDLKAAIKATWACVTPEQCHRLIASMPRRIDAVIHAKGGPTKYWVHRNEHTFQKPDISVFYWFISPFLLILCNIIIFWDTKFGVFIICKP